MKRGKTLGLLTLVLLLLVGGTVLAKNQTAKVTEPEEEERAVLYEEDTGLLSALSWTKDGETVTLVKNGEDWNWKEDPDFPLSNTKAEMLVSALTGLRAEKTIDRPEALSVYGLDEPALQITVTADTETSFRIGSGKSLDGYHYLSNGDGKVYLVDENLTERFSCGIYDLIRKESLPDMSKTLSMKVLSKVQNYEIDHLEDSGIDYTDQYEWFLKEEDGWLTLDSSLTEDFADQVRILAWQECVDYRADDAALAEYGLDQPAVTVELRYTEDRQEATEILAEDGNPIYDTVEEEKTFLLEIGDYADASCCYARIAGSAMVYKISSSVCDALLYMSYDELRPKDVIRLDTEELTEIEVTLDGKIHTFRKGRKNAADETENGGAETIYLLEGEETAFADVLNSLQGMLSDRYADGETPKREAVLSLVFHRENEKHPRTELVFYSYDSSDCLVTLDGKSTVFVDRYSVNSLVDRIRSLTGGEGVQTSGQETEE